MLVYLGCHLDMSVLPYIEVSKCVYAIFKEVDVLISFLQLLLLIIVALY